MDGFDAEYIAMVLRQYKTLILRKTNVLELQSTVSENDIGGLDLFKAWMHERKLTFKEEAIDAGATPSRGALVIGPPGTGKSLVAKAAGDILQLPVIRFDVGRVFNSYIGQSETTMRSVLNMIDAMSPCVLMIDEIDKGFAGMVGGGSNDSGTTSRVFGTFLTWMQERNQKARPVFLIMTANRIDGLPPELLRKGRVDEIWSVNLPNEPEREEIVKIHLRKRKQELETGEIKAIVRLTDKLVGSEIEQLIEDALVISLSDKPGVTYDLVEQANQYLKPMSKTREAEFTAMQRWAADNARAASSSAVPSSDKPKLRDAKARRPRSRIKRK
jgi:SpoVK/Ycf46/Vps4 family AAA+-type ATPase